MGRIWENKATTESGTVLGACLVSSLKCFLVLWLEFFGDAPTPPVPTTVSGTCSDTHFLLDDVPWGAVWAPSLTPDISRCCPPICWINDISRFHSWTRLFIFNFFLVGVMRDNVGVNFLGNETIVLKILSRVYFGCYLLEQSKDVSDFLTDSREQNQMFPGCFWVISINLSDFTF